MSNQTPYSADPLQPPIPRPSGNNNSVWIIVAIFIVGLPMLLVCAGVLVGLLLPAVQAAREAARRSQCQNNVKQIALAMFNYESVYGSFPPAYTVDEAGNKLHSWRTLILPFLEQDALYQQIDMSRPWDDPVNAPFASMSIPQFECPSTPLNAGKTQYVAVVDPSGVFAGAVGTQISQIADGTSNTLLFVETDTVTAVNWMSPNDITLQQFLNLGSTSHPGGGSMAMSDGSCQFLSAAATQPIKTALVTKAGAD